MEESAKFLSALAAVAWPVLVGGIIYWLRVPLWTFVGSWVNRKVTVKAFGTEFTLDELSKMQNQTLSDLQSKLSDLEKRIGTQTNPAQELKRVNQTRGKRVLWVDDHPKNNSLLISSLADRGINVDIALSTDEGLQKLTSGIYDVVISDMDRPESKTAGIDLAKRLRAVDSTVPFFIFCSPWAAQNLRDPALQAKVTEITSSGTSLLTLLALDDES